MALQPVNRRSVPEDVFEQILADVLSGEMQPGETLPSERRLAEVLGVSRPAVREALKRVSAAGLVEVRQGDATTVRDLASEHDPVERQRHALTFWDHVVDGADSIVFRLMYNTLRATYEPALPALAAVMSAEVGRPEAYRRIADAIAAGDPAAAKQSAVDLLEPATTAMLAVITNLEEQA